MIDEYTSLVRDMLKDTEYQILSPTKDIDCIEVVVTSNQKMIRLASLALNSKKAKLEVTMYYPLEDEKYQTGAGGIFTNLDLANPNLGDELRELIDEVREAAKTQDPLYQPTTDFSWTYGTIPNSTMQTIYGTIHGTGPSIQTTYGTGTQTLGISSGTDWTCTTTDSDSSVTTGLLSQYTVSTSWDDLIEDDED